MVNAHKLYFTRITMLALFVSISSLVWSQSKQIISCGTIKYERKISLKKKLIESKDEDDDNFWMEEMIKKAPVNVVDQFVLQFNMTESNYSFDKKKDDGQFRMWGSDDVGMKNIVYKNFINREQRSLKQFYDSDFLLMDSIKNFNWKLTSEFRDIAGYECRKATTIINDSLYVIAFYTDDIICSTGPEGFSGLPGTIMGIVMPRLYCTWFATSVEGFCDENREIVKPVKGKKSTQSDLEAILKDKFSKHKKWYQSMVWNLVI